MIVQPDPLIARLAEVIRRQLRSQQISQSAYARAAGVAQYQLNRLLNGRTKTVTRDVLKLCSYADIDARLTVPLPLDHPRLREALEKVWDGRPRTIEALARLIECAGPLLIFGAANREGLSLTEP